MEQHLYATSGIPQGGHLLQFLFLLLINDISVLKKCKFLLFADDLRLFMRVFSIDDYIIYNMN